MEFIYQTEDGIRGPDKDTILANAISHHLGYDDWTLVEVADRGRFLVFRDQYGGTWKEVFLFDEMPLVLFIRVHQSEHERHISYELLYEDNN